MAIASNNDFPSILFSELAVKPDAPAANHWRLYMKDDNKLYREDSGGTETEVGSGGGVGDVTWAAILASQLCNEIKGWPPVVNTGDLAALNLWWDSVSTPSTAPSVVAVGGEGITETFELAMKVVADGANEGLSQRWTYADEPRVKSGRVLSTLWAIWCVGGVGVTAKLVNQTAEETAAAEVTAAAWTIVEIPNHTLAGTYCDVQLLTDGAGTFYAVPLGANIGARGLPLRPRGLRYVDIAAAVVVNGVDPGGAGFTDVDCTANTSNITAIIQVEGKYNNATTTGKVLQIRRNGDTDATGKLLAYASTLNVTYGVSRIALAVDDGQIFEYKTNGAAGDTELVTLVLNGYWEWE